MQDLELFRRMLAVDSTSGHEAEFTTLLKDLLEAPELRTFPDGNGGENLLFCWGEPRLVFCTHQDTVPPYIPPAVPERVTVYNGVEQRIVVPGYDVIKVPGDDPGNVIYGRGTCDAKGQILAMYYACRQLHANGRSGFGLLLLTGEEVGSVGAKAFSKTGFEAEYLVIGEPTENKMVSASKGTKAFELTFKGEAFHSGYPQFGRSAVSAFVDFVEWLRGVDFPSDRKLGSTTWNIGKLISDNPQNILSPELTCRLYFRTTFASDAFVSDLMADIPSVIAGSDRQSLVVKALGGDSPSEYMTLDGFPTTAVAFGSDAPHLTGFKHKMIMGPGSIRYAHRPDEQIDLHDIDIALYSYMCLADRVLR